MKTPSAAINALPVPPNAWNAFGGIWRLTVRRLFQPARWLMFAGLLALLIAVTMGNAPWRNSPEQTLVWIGEFYIAFLVPIFAFIAAAGTMRDDLKPEAVDYLCTRPVSRPARVVFRYLSHLACSQVDFVIVLAALVGLGIVKGVPGLWAAIPLLLLCQLVITAAFSGLGFLCGALTSRYIIIGLAYGAVVEVGIGNIPTQLSRFSLTRQVVAVLEPLTNGGNAIVAGGSVFGMTAWLLAFAAMTLGAAAAIIALREPGGASSPAA